jgi:uncharacterized membrane protein YhhN
MKRIDQLFLNLYLIFAIAHIFSIAQAMENISVVSKILLMPMLMLYVYTGCRRSLKIKLPWLTALSFCWLGDLIMVFAPGNENYFLIGLVCFLLGHIYYIVCFKKYSAGMPSLLAGRQWIAIPPVIYSAGVIIILFPYLNEMKIPIIIYSFVITLMVIFAINRFGRTNLYSFIFVLCGAIFFMIADTLIAITKFYLPVEYGSILIMATYIIA